MSAVIGHYVTYVASHVAAVLGGGGGGAYTPAYQFDDARNSFYLPML